MTIKPSHIYPGRRSYNTLYKLIERYDRRKTVVQMRIGNSIFNVIIDKNFVENRLPLSGSCIYKVERHATIRDYMQQQMHGQMFNDNITVTMPYMYYVIEQPTNISYETLEVESY